MFSNGANKELISKIYKQLMQLCAKKKKAKKTQLKKKWAENLKTFLQRHKQMVKSTLKKLEKCKPKLQ